MTTFSARRLGFALGLVILGVGLGLYLGVAVPAGAQGPANAEEPWMSDGSAPGFEGFMPPPVEFPQGTFMLNDQYVYVMMGRTLYQFRHDRFPDGMKQFTFKPELPQPPRPFMPGPGSRGQ